MTDKKTITPSTPAQHGGNQQIQAPAKPATSLEDIIVSRKQAFAEVSTKYLTPERLVKLAVVAVSKMPDLRRAPAIQVITELINCARLGLEPNQEGGRWLLPFKKGNAYEVVGVTDYRGLIDIARRSGEVIAIHADVVRANDLWEFWVEAGGATLVHLRHRRAPGEAEERGEILGAYAIVKLKSGEVQAEFLTLSQINGFKARSRGAGSEFSPWQRDWEAMAKKTVVRRLYNFLPKTPEITQAREVLADEDAKDRDAVEVQATPVAAEAPGFATATLADRVAHAAAKAAGGTPGDEWGLDAEAQAADENREPGQEG
jgi:recombination protein RecT